MSIQVTAEMQFLPGQSTFVEGAAPDGEFVAIFEDDEATGYFYAVDPSADGNSIQDAVQIYSVSSVTERDNPSVIKIGWSADSQKVLLLINGHPHAVFDFEAKRGYCRTAYPPPNANSNWRTYSHDWSDDAMELFT